MSLFAHRTPKLRTGASTQILSGAGLPGITISKVYQNSLVTVSDYPDPLVISALEENIQRNGIGGRCYAAPYDWGTSTASLLSTSDKFGSESPLYDVIIAADTLWNSEFHDIFLQSLTMALRRSRSARVYIVAGFHTGRFTLESFRKMVAQARWGLEVLDLKERQVHTGENRAWDVSRADYEDERERRSWLLWMTLGWKQDFL
jgi:nicotinamide N-methyltransferase